MNKVRIESSRQVSISYQDDNSETDSRSPFDRPKAHKGNKHRLPTDKYMHLDPNYARRCNWKEKEEIKMKGTPAKRNLITGYLARPVQLPPKNTSEQSTQTDKDDISSAVSHGFGKIISNLYAKILSLKNQLSEKHQHDPDISVDGSINQRYINQDDDFNEGPINPQLISSNMADSIAIDSIEADASDDEVCEPEGVKLSTQIVQHMPKVAKMVPIGAGYASVPAKLLKMIDWSSYKKATRKLLTAVFSKRVLATHSISGKPSPLFPDKPVKKKLNPEQVNDIVHTVVERCGVTAKVVRRVISMKCKDVCKLYKKEKASFKKNQENVSPSPKDVDES